MCCCILKSGGAQGATLGVINRGLRGERWILSYERVSCKLHWCLWHFSIRNPIKCSQLWSGTFGRRPVFFLLKISQSLCCGAGSVGAWTNGLDMMCVPHGRESAEFSSHEPVLTLLMSILIPRTWSWHGGGGRRKKKKLHCLTMFGVRGRVKEGN